MSQRNLSSYEWLQQRAAANRAAAIRWSDKGHSEQRIERWVQAPVAISRHALAKLKGGIQAGQLHQARDRFAMVNLMRALTGVVPLGRAWNTEGMINSSCKILG